MKYGEWYNLGERLINRFKYDEVAALGAQLTYYLILSFFPFIIFLITIISYTPLTHEETIKTLENIMPPQTYELVQQVIHQVLSSNRHTLLSFGMVATIWTASRGTNALIRGINKAYDQEETRPFWKVNGIAILFTLSLASVIIFTFVLLILGEVLGKYFFYLLGIPELFKTTWNLIRFIVALLSMITVFSSIYYYIPDKRLSFKKVLPGSIFAVIGWLLLSTVFSYYVKNFNDYASAYGSLGGVIILLLWLYWSSIIILLGAELNAILNN